MNANPSNGKTEEIKHGHTSRRWPESHYPYRNITQTPTDFYRDMDHLPKVIYHLFAGQ